MPIPMYAPEATNTSRGTYVGISEISIGGVPQAKNAQKRSVTENLADIGIATPKTSRELAHTLVDKEFSKLGKLKISISFGSNENTSKPGLSPLGVGAEIKQSHKPGKIGEVSAGFKKKLSDNVTACLDIKTADIVKALQNLNAGSAKDILPSISAGAEITIPGTDKIPEKILSVLGFDRYIKSTLGPGNFSELVLKVAAVTGEYPIAIQLKVPYKTQNAKFTIAIKFEILPNIKFIQKIAKIGTKFSGKLFNGFMAKFLSKCPFISKLIVKMGVKGLGRLNIGLSILLTAYDVHKAYVAFSDWKKIERDEETRARTTAETEKIRLGPIRKKLFALEYANLIFNGELKEECKKYRSTYRTSSRFVDNMTRRNKISESDTDYKPEKAVLDYAKHKVKGDLQTNYMMKKELFEVYAEIHQALINSKINNAKKQIPMFRDLAAENAGMDIIRLFFIDCLSLDGVTSAKELESKLRTT